MMTWLRNHGHVALDTSPPAVYPTCVSVLGGQYVTPSYTRIIRVRARVKCIRAYTRIHEKLPRHRFIPATSSLYPCCQEQSRSRTGLRRASAPPVGNAARCAALPVEDRLQNALSVREICVPSDHEPRPNQGGYTVFPVYTDGPCRVSPI